MTNVLELAAGMSIAVKIAWAILLLWTCGQVYWYRQGREVVLPPMKPEARRPSPRRKHDGHDAQPEGAPI
jgi:hypothetical protein